jgi:putative transposase
MISKTRNNYRSHWHCVYSMHFHLVLVTKYRQKCFTNEMLKRLEQICYEQCQKWDIKCIEFGGEEDHIHLLLELHPNIMPSKFINSLKTAGGAPISILKQYIQNQEKPQQ